MYFLVASSFWNFLGAGVFGFLINLPIVNYFEHGTYLTVNHGHGALFGVYGMLSIALLLFSWRGLVQREHWNDRLLTVSFWGLNGGLLATDPGDPVPGRHRPGLDQLQGGSLGCPRRQLLRAALRVAARPAAHDPGHRDHRRRSAPAGLVPVPTFRHLKAKQIADGESVWKRLDVEL